MSLSNAKKVRDFTLPALKGHPPKILFPLFWFGFVGSFQYRSFVESGVGKVIIMTLLRAPRTTPAPYPYQRPTADGIRPSDDIALLALP